MDASHRARQRAAEVEDVEAALPRWMGQRHGCRQLRQIVHRQFASPCASSERWNEAAINEYGDFATFRAIADTETYRREVAPHRHAALEDFRLFALAKAM